MKYSKITQTKVWMRKIIMKPIYNTQTPITVSQWKLYDVTL